MAKGAAGTSKEIYRVLLRELQASAGTVQITEGTSQLSLSASLATKPIVVVVVVVVNKTWLLWWREVEGGPQLVSEGGVGLSRLQGEILRFR